MEAPVLLRCRSQIRAWALLESGPVWDWHLEEEELVVSTGETGEFTIHPFARAFRIISPRFGPAWVPEGSRWRMERVR